MLGKISKFVLMTVGVSLLSFTAGCSSEGDKSASKLAAAKGVVKYNGKPVAGANVLFSPKEGSPAMGMTDKDGNFTVTTGGRPGAEIGKFKVVVSKQQSIEGGKPVEQMKPEDMERMIREGKSLTPPKPEFPTRYTSLDTTTLEADVAADAASNVFEFNLVD